MCILENSKQKYKYCSWNSIILDMARMEDSRTWTPESLYSWATFHRWLCLCVCLFIFSSHRSWMVQVCTSTSSTTTSLPYRSAIRTPSGARRRFEVLSSGFEPKTENSSNWSQSGSSSGTHGQRRSSTWSAKTTCWSPTRRWKAAVALLEAGTWSSSRMDLVKITQEAGTSYLYILERFYHCTFASPQ